MNKEPIFVKESDIPITKYRKQLLKLFLTNGGYNTYSSKEYDNNVLQCERGRYRSITDLYRIVLSRFPNTSFGAIIQIIKELIDDENGRVQMVWCTQVEKVVLKYIGENEAKYYMSDYSRLKYFDNKGLDGFSLSDYELMITKLNN